MLNPNEIIYYVIPPSYDYIPSKLKLLLEKTCFKSWSQIHMTIIDPPCEKWPSMRNGNQFDDPNWMEEILWPLVCIAHNVRIFNRISRVKRNQEFQRSSPISREDFKEAIKNLIPQSNYLCVLFENNDMEVEMAVYYQSGEELFFLVKTGSLEQVKKILDLHGREITCWEYEHHEIE